jgi:hypothetical protein
MVAELGLEYSQGAGDEPDRSVGMLARAAAGQLRGPSFEVQFGASRCGSP